MSEPLLVVRDLRVVLPTHRGPVAALRGIDLTIGRGDTVGLIGESGCGKSMTALALAGLLPEGARVTGSLQLAGRPGSGEPGQELATLDEVAWCRVRGARIGMVFQEPMTALNPLHTVGDQIAEPLRLHRRLSRSEAGAEALRLLEAVRLPQARERLAAYPHQLSGGQRQRVGIAIALACGPDLLIADEPTTALDVTIQREILDLLAELVASRGMALLLISHDLGVVSRSVRTVHVMYGGLVVDGGPVHDVFSRLAHPYTRGLFGARPRLGRTRGTRLAAIPGRVPELMDLPAGCPFADRCTLAIDACAAAVPPARPVPGTPAGDTHRVRCVRAEDLVGVPPQPGPDTNR